MRNLIVAISDNNAIGVNGQLPWHISEDLKYFKSVTTGSPVIMGRSTFESIGRPLPGRRNIVLSRSTQSIEGVEIAHSVEEAYDLAGESFFVIGGAKVYATSLNDMDRLYVTYVHTTINQADAFFPTIDTSMWKEESRSEIKTDPITGLEFEFVVYRNLASV